MTLDVKILLISYDKDLFKKKKRSKMKPHVRGFNS